MSRWTDAGSRASAMSCHGVRSGRHDEMQVRHRWRHDSALLVACVPQRRACAARRAATSAARTATATASFRCCASSTTRACCPVPPLTLCQISRSHASLVPRARASFSSKVGHHHSAGLRSARGFRYCCVKPCTPRCVRRRDMIVIPEGNCRMAQGSLRGPRGRQAEGRVCDLPGAVAQRHLRLAGPAKEPRQGGGPLPRPVLRPLDQRPLHAGARLSVVSAERSGSDACHRVLCRRCVIIRTSSVRRAMHLSHTKSPNPPSLALCLLSRRSTLSSSVCSCGNCP